jgi:UPF0755 protein
MADPPAARRQRGRILLKLLGALFLLAVLAGAVAAVGYVWVNQLYSAPGPANSVTRIEVAQGASLRSVLARLESAGALSSARGVEWYLRIKGHPVKVESGRYEIPAHASPEEILTLFADGRVVLEQLTVVEGTTFADFLEVLNAQADLAHTLRGRTPEAVMAALGHPGEAAEGRFFPDTYRFAAGTSDAAILARAYEAMQRELTSAWQARAPGLPLQDAYQALILASLVEKEAQLKSERALIAGVFVNRLKKGMRLQSDPTVVYGLGASYDGAIHTRDLQTDSPYNTYTRAGLPPTPIALPGHEALLAAVQPQDSGALYFVATGSGDGAHHFSRTLEEHTRAVQSYLGRLRGGHAGGSAAPPAHTGATGRP